MKYPLVLFSILLIISCSCQKSSDENLVQMNDLEKQQTEKVRHLPSINPIQGGMIISRFGQQVDSLINKGIDITVEKEADVFAVADGKIAEFKKGMMNKENLIIIDNKELSYYFLKNWYSRKK